MAAGTFLAKSEVAGICQNGGCLVPLSQPDKRRQHYVPKCYLKGFCNDRGMLVVLDVEQEPNVRTNPRCQRPDEVAWETHFYRVNPITPSDEAISATANEAGFDLANPDMIEEHLSRRVEAPVAPVLRTMRERLGLPGRDGFWALMEFLAWQLVRTKRFRKMVGVARAEERDQQTKNTGKISIDPSTEIFVQYMFAMLQDWSIEFMARHWYVVRAPEGTHLITSDAPVVPLVPRSRRGRESGGPPDWTLYIPISPRFGLVGVLVKVEKWWERLGFTMDYPEPANVQLTPAAVANLNCIMALKCDRWLFSSEETVPWRYEDISGNKCADLIQVRRLYDLTLLDMYAKSQEARS